MATNGLLKNITYYERVNVSDFSDVLNNILNTEKQDVDKESLKNDFDKLQVDQQLSLIESLIQNNLLEKYAYLVDLLPSEKDSTRLLFARLYRTGILYKEDKKKALYYYKLCALSNPWARLELLIWLNKIGFDNEHNLSNYGWHTHSKVSLAIDGLNEKNAKFVVDRFPCGHYTIVGLLGKPITNVDASSCLGLLYPDVKKVDVVLRAPDIVDSSKILFESEIISKKIIRNDILDAEGLCCSFGENNTSMEFNVCVPSYGLGILSIAEVFSKMNAIFSNESIVFADMENYPSTCISFEEIGHFNPWNLLYSNYTTYPMDEIYSSNSVTFWKINNNNIDKKKMSQIGWEDTKFSDSLSKKIKNVANDLFLGKKQILGIQARGTDYISVKPPGHLIPFDEYELSEIIKNRLNYKKYDWIYISTEDLSIYNHLKRIFKNKLISIKQERFEKENCELYQSFDTDCDQLFQKINIAEKYILATLLFQYCSDVIVTAGTAISLIKKVVSPDRIIHCRKGKWGELGDNPLIVTSTGCNLLEILPSAKYEYHDGTILIRGDNIDLLLDDELKLYGTSYRNRVLYFESNNECIITILEYNRDKKLVERKYTGPTSLKSTTTKLSIHIENISGKPLELRIWVRKDDHCEFNKFFKCITEVPIIDS